MGLREMGEPFEKKYIQLSEKDIKKITDTYHNWQCWDNAMSLSATSLSDMEETDNLPAYQDVPEFCYSAGIEEIREKDYSLVPSRYIEFVNRDEEVDFDEKMKTLQQEIGELLQKEKQSRNELLRVFEDLGFKIELK